MKSSVISRNTVLAIVCALVLVILYTSGAFAQGTASIKALFGQETGTVTTPVVQEQPIPARQ